VLAQRAGVPGGALGQFRVLAYADSPAYDLEPLRAHFEKHVDFLLLQTSSRRGRAHGYAVLVDMALLEGATARDFFVFLDADRSVLLPGAVSMLLELSEKNEGIPCLWGGDSPRSVTGEDLLSGSMLRASVFTGSWPTVSTEELSRGPAAALMALPGRWTPAPAVFNVPPSLDLQTELARALR
jgi:hypothetical protein